MAGLPGLQISIFSKVKTDGRNHQVSRLDVSGEGHIDGEEIEAGHVCEKDVHHSPVSPVSPS